MAGRTRLRSRVFLMTALYAAVLIAISFVLTWRAQWYETEFQRLRLVESSAVSALENLIQNQGAWNLAWQAMPLGNRQEARRLARSYRAVRQLVEARSLGEDDAARLRPGIVALEADVKRWSEAWPALDPDQRRARVEEIERRSLHLIEEARRLSAAHEREIDRTLRQLTFDAKASMWTALGTAWIVAILSFAAARTALTRVVRPIEDLARAAERLAEGDLDARAPVGGDLEIAQLGMSFHRMAEALAASHARLHQRAHTDELTALPNFRAFREAIDLEIERAERFEKTFGVLIMDLDHFKSYNDTWGHQAGNEALELVAQTLRQSVRTIDVPARYGGEEFAVILPAADASGIAALAERIRAAVEALPPIAQRRPLTVSIGGAVYPHDGDNADELFAAADRRLYQSKDAGRNRAVTPEVVES